jgi:predicted polyphosphate/ATP-dependent NAD kinase
MGSVGVIVNPQAGKDIRRLVSPASHTADSAKIGVVRRVIAAAGEAGADRVWLAGDPNRLAERAAQGLGVDVEIVPGELTGSRHDTISAAAHMASLDVGAVVVLGGDGTNRDAAKGWPQLPLVAISTGTNNVFPSTIDGTSAGMAAGLVASGAIGLHEVGRSAKRIDMVLEDEAHPEGVHDLALVDLALVAASFTGARAVTEPRSLKWVVAAIAPPASTGMASIAGRVHPVERFEPAGVLVMLGDGGRRVRVPLAPGAFASVEVGDVIPLAPGERRVLPGVGVLAFDGERDRRLGEDARLTVWIDIDGPVMIDVDATLHLAAQRRLFDDLSDITTI